MSLYSVVNKWREYLTPASHTSTFASTGQLTPEEFILAGDYLCYKFPLWSWQPADAAHKQVSHLPAEKQYLLLRNAPCHTRLDEHFSSWNIGDDEGEGEEGWVEGKGEDAVEKVRREVEGLKVDQEEEEEDEDEIPDMEDEDDEEVVRSDKKRKSGSGAKAPFRTYNIYITYSTYYRVPRIYLSGHAGSNGLPLTPPTLMLDDIAPDYREKTVTLEEFPHMEHGVQMASVHPCKHAEVMKKIFDSMLRRHERREREKAKAREGEETKKEESKEEHEGEGWDVIESEEEGLRVDQYLVVFIKAFSGVMPGVEMDNTMGI